MELPRDSHPYFLAVQFHPEFKSRPLRPAPVFLGLLQAVKENKGVAGPGPVNGEGLSKGIIGVESSMDAVIDEQTKVL